MPKKNRFLIKLLAVLFLSPSLLYATCYELEGQTNCDNTLSVGGKVGIGLTNPSAQNHVAISSMNTVGQIIKAASGQTADLEEWQDSNGVALASVTANGTIVASTLSVTNLAISNLNVSTLTVANKFTVTGASLSAPAAFTTAPAPFNPGYTYIGLSTTTPVHIFESYESWPGDNSTRWVITNTSDGYSVITAKALNSSNTANLLYNGGGASGSWFPGYPAANAGGIDVGGPGSPGIFMVTGSSVAIGTDVGAGIVEFFVKGTKVFSFGASSVTIPSTYKIPGLITQSVQVLITTACPTTSSSYAALGAKVQITPKFSSSRIHIYYSGGLRNSNPTADTCKFTLEANGSDLVSDNLSIISATSANPMDVPGNMEIDFSPGSTSAQMIEVYAKTTAGASTCTANNNGTAVLHADEITQ